jgi:CheY-like chemotaxis protein
MSLQKISLHQRRVHGTVNVVTNSRFSEPDNENNAAVGRFTLARFVGCARITIGLLWVLDVLIVDDDLSITDMLQEVLEAECYGVCGIARTVEEAIKVAEQHQPDFAVIDVHLANGGSGTAVGEYLCKTTKIKIMFSTGKDNDQLTERHGDVVITETYPLGDVGHGLKIIGEIAEFGRTKLAFPRNFRLLSPALP